MTSVTLRHIQLGSKKLDPNSEERLIDSGEEDAEWKV